MHIKHINIIDYIYYICNLIHGKVGFWNSTTLAHGIPSLKHPGAPNSWSSEDYEKVKTFSHDLFPILFGLRSFML
jgi:hypothetical protein